MAISSNLGFIVGSVVADVLSAIIYQEILPVLAALVLSNYLDCYMVRAKRI